ncbi:hypothetical protein [Tuwongella immobilis]|uniref:Uncharacterized protein n=1 Tax=Tuwongella immobilis TaxID=692036 RepID=A0A6C2YPJ1_9BACT|nr:hypothetical protein [Tuwongella immobilis]VIP03043.1 Uncharacterized protein OS=Candidatus Entotheonella sp. TSY2 GN=ETSY2_13505 PE=4 SV=1 [Tuwongella immobilis]VTS03216.1 Uncharacterized protein OS=Candidatus Entotheonella sp. TSY2 GN=ETSY2_13505 PE=4 SV=1 [Tuwongella immobilis]
MLRICLIVGLLVGTDRVGAHPTSPNDAIRAPIIAELRIQSDGMRLELEIADDETEAFADLLTANPQGKLREFCERKWIIEDDDDNPFLADRVEVTRRAKVARDPITGQPMGILGGKQPMVNVITLHYPLRERLPQITLTPPRRNDGTIPPIGLVVVHETVPVNDFDFFAYRETVRLDWNDPWYSRVRSPRLKRYYETPVGVFVYVDAREIQIEVIVRLQALLAATPIASNPLPGAGDVVSMDRSQLQRLLADRLAGNLPVTMDGRTVIPQLDQFQWLRLSLSRLDLLDATAPLQRETDLIGAIFVAPFDRTPKEFQLRWNLFGETISKVKGVVNNAAVPSTLTPDQPELRWQNPNPPGASDVTELPAVILPPTWSLPVPTLICAVLLLRWAVRRPQPEQRTRHWIRLGIVLLVGILLVPFGRVAIRDPWTPPTPITDADAAAIIRERLLDVYHAFDFRSEEAIYDTLARSVSGDLLRQTYLEIKRTLDNQTQGARARVKALDLLSATATPLPDGVGFQARCRWSVRVAMNHWGHTHERTNQYDAELMVRPIDGEWKLVGLKILDEIIPEPPAPPPLPPGAVPAPAARSRENLP